MFDERIHWERGNETFTARRVVRVIERSEDRSGQPLLPPEVELEGYWTNLDGEAFPADELIALYQRRGTSEQYHSEFKTDLDVERLPSGKFETNALVLSPAAIAYNILRYIGQNTLIGPEAPVRKAVHRRRLRTAPREIIYKAVRLIRHGRRYLVRFGAMRPGLSRAGEVLSTGDGGLNPRQITSRTTTTYREVEGTSRPQHAETRCMERSFGAGGAEIPEKLHFRASSSPCTLEKIACRHISTMRRCRSHGFRLRICDASHP